MSTSNSPLTEALIGAASNAAEQLGGARLTDKCVGTTAVYAKPKRIKVTTCACGNDLKIAVPYALDQTAAQKGAINRGGGLATFCLICDHGIQFPRMAKAIRDQIS